MTSLRQMVFKYKDDHPNAKPLEILEKFPDANEGSIRTYIKQWQGNIAKKSNIPKKKSSHFSAPPQGNTGFIDDPDELLYSVAIRELNKPNPNPQWARVLIEARQKIKQKDELVDTLQKSSIKELTEILKKRSGRSSPIE